MTFALPGRSIGGGTSGGEVKTAFTSGSVAGAAPAPVSCGLFHACPPTPATIAAAAITPTAVASPRFMIRLLAVDGMAPGRSRVLLHSLQFEAIAPPSKESATAHRPLSLALVY